MPAEARAREGLETLSGFPSKLPERLDQNLEGQALGADFVFAACDELA